MREWGSVRMSILKDLIRIVFGGKEEEDLTLNARLEFRLNKKEKELIKKYCELRQITISEFMRSSATKEIDSFIKVNNQKGRCGNGKKDFWEIKSDCE